MRLSWLLTTSLVFMASVSAASATDTVLFDAQTRPAIIHDKSAPSPMPQTFWAATLRP